MSEKVAIVGTGLVGRAWSIVFARGGMDVCLWDPVEGVSANALRNIEKMLPELEEFGLLGNYGVSEVRGRLKICDDLRAALDGARHMQESGPERVEVKREIYRELVAHADDNTVLASSTSGIPSSAFTAQLSTRERCLVAHPINPPHIVPAVEIVPAAWTDADVVRQTAKLMRQVGQVPIELAREVEGFVVNRLQGALLAEAFRLVEDGVCAVDDVDAAIADGLGLRWSFIGPFETIDLNSPTGVRGYCDMLGPLYYALAKDQADPRPWTESLVDKVEAQRRQHLSEVDIAERQAWRDRRLAQLVGHKREAD